MSELIEEFSDNDLIKWNVTCEAEKIFGLSCSKVRQLNDNHQQENSSHTTTAMIFFNYSGRVIISIDDYHIKNNVKIRRVKKLFIKSQ